MMIYRTLKNRKTQPYFPFKLKIKMARKQKQTEQHPWEDPAWPNDEAPGTNRPITDEAPKCVGCKKPIATTMYSHKCFACNQLKREKKEKDVDAKKCTVCEKPCPSQYDTCFKCKFPNTCECGAKCRKEYAKCYTCSTLKKPDASF